MGMKDKEPSDKNKKLVRVDFPERGREALVQQREFLDNTSKFTIQNVGKIISKWIQERSEFTKLEKPFLYDMKQLLEKDKINSSIEDIEQEIIVQLGRDFYEYIYVTHRDDGMVVSVGKSSKTKNSVGDLFYELNTNRLVGTANIILRAKYGNEIFEEYDNFLKKYLDTAWIIPIESGSAIELEGSLGDFLIEKGVPILNYYSHWPYK